MDPRKDISKEIVLMKLNYVFTLGNGSKVKFWEDIWCGENPFVILFQPCIY